MKLVDVRFHAPRGLEEALALLEGLKDARVMAGGTDLLVDIKQGLREVRDIVSLHRIAELKGIEDEGDRLRIGALVTVRELASNAAVAKHIPALADAARSMASEQIRSIATIGGNISSAVPSADLPPPLIAADAGVELESSRSARRMSLLEFFTGPRETVCLATELLRSVVIPLPPPNTGISYFRFTLREASALAVASVACRITLKSGVVDRATVVLGAVAPTPILANKASRSLLGKNPSAELFREAASHAKEEAKPISDIRGCVWHRKELVHVLTQRALAEALERALGKAEVAE
ncbi:MAG: xanthine dehydrogenase family protein subunit M [Candidatus Eiseniibacteriota bacterium]|nr:MAG: xanthine dehydrogenase family protein subunit M [Candidatus Eisenbacteria bacterium]